MINAINAQETSLLRSEIELLMNERQSMLMVVGAAASLVAELDSRDLPKSAIEAAELLSEGINALPEETLQDALNAVHAQIA
ncbi:hypothetical protein GALL_352960 [mine drainage metagenome]|uniref:Uncharacterized protein n=1 Tax=mine drainage metagenome TaxID=410659 RepID=A0A1J5R425_9ZZZZ